MIKTSQKLAVITLLASLSLAVSACGKKPVPVANTNLDVNQAVNQNLNTNIATTTEEIDISDWKTYRNEEYGFEFKYPEDWKIQEKFFQTNELFVLKGESRLAILPNGELDLGLPYENPLIKDSLVSNALVKFRQWNLNNGKFLIVYNFLDEITNWTKCDDNLKNCNRIELFAQNKGDLNILINIILTFKFLK
ncbi:MAG: hypothetical protein WC768_01115 [Patescibacteria group bacterium]|jgi:hypothetical protein